MLFHAQCWSHGKLIHNEKYIEIEKKFYKAKWIVHKRKMQRIKRWLQQPVRNTIKVVFNQHLI